MPPGVGGRRLVGRVDQVELLEQLGDAAPARVAAEVAQVGHQPQVLRAGEQAVDGGELAGHADAVARTAVGVGDDVVAGDAGLAAVGGEQRGQDVDHGRLAGAVGPEQGEDRALGDLEVDAVEHDRVAEGLAEPGRS